MTHAAAPDGTRPLTWFITGASSGIGREIAELLLARGDRVAGTSRNLDNLADLKSRYGPRLWTAELDVTRVGDIARVANEAVSTFGGIDVVVNNAGYGAFGAAEEFDDEQVAQHIATNLTGSIAVARAFLPHLRAQRGGRIVQISSYGGQVANAGASLYNASKFGIEGFMEALAKEVEPFGVGVTIVEPGGTPTNFRANAVLASPSPDYDQTPAAAVRRLREPGVPSPVDPKKVAHLVVDASQRIPAPLRVVLGSDSFGFVQHALTARLADVVTQKESAARADRDTND